MCYIKIHAITWIRHRLPRGALQGIFAIFWELTLSWLNQRQKTICLQWRLREEGRQWHVMDRHGAEYLWPKVLLDWWQPCMLFWPLLLPTGILVNMITQDTMRFLHVAVIHILRNGMTDLAPLRHLLFCVRSRLFSIQKGNVALV